MCENISIFCKYNYAGLSKQMQGAVVGNYFAVTSRVFISLYAVFIAYLIEANSLQANFYAFSLAISILVACLFSFFLSKIRLTHKLTYSRFGSFHKIIFYKPDELHSIPSVSFIIMIFVGVQFIASSFAYILCLNFPANRLFIISLAPVASMVGTLISITLVEPKYARCIDQKHETSFGISSAYLLGRCLSFLVCTTLFLVFVVLY